MWNSTSQRIKALMASSAREKDRLTRPIRVRRSPIKVAFQMLNGEKVEAAARAVLNDFTLDGTCLYISESLAPNLELTIEIFHPRHFKIEGKVVWSQYQSGASAVITENPYPYRAGIAFRWTNENEKKRFEHFIAETQHEFDSAIYPKPAPLPPELEEAAQTQEPAQLATVTELHPTGSIPPAESVEPSNDSNNNEVHNTETSASTEDLKAA